MTEELSWKALEANPDVIEKYARFLGAPANLMFSDVLSIEDWGLAMVPRPVVALLLVYPITKVSEAKKQEVEKILCQKDKTPTYWFTKQTIPNACGTVALLHIYGNVRDRYPPLRGGLLDKYYQETEAMAPEERAEALKDTTSIVEAHRRAERLGQSSVKEDVNEHFIAFVHSNGRVIELDGRKSGPLVHSETSDFLADACRIIKTNYMDADPNQLNFSIIAVSEKH